jgi:hypothetical protein
VYAGGGGGSSTSSPGVVSGVLSISGISTGGGGAGNKSRYLLGRHAFRICKPEGRYCWGGGVGDETVFIKHHFTELPSLLVFEFANNMLHIDFLINFQSHNGHHRMRLAGIVYYGQHHFTAQIILSDGQIWFHDGIDTGRNLVYGGSISNPNSPNMSYCRGKQAVAAIYVGF